MTDKKLEQLLSILDENEISLDIDYHELSLLSDDLVDRLQMASSKYNIITILKTEITKIKNQVSQNGLTEWEEKYFPGLFEEFISSNRKR